MRCPACGHENSSLATRCASCGATLTSAPATPSPQQAPSPGGTEERLQTTIDAPEPRMSSDPKLREVAGTAGRFVHSKWQHIGSFFHKHQRALGVGVALALVSVFGLTWLVINVFDAPTYTKIESDLASMLPTFEYSGGAYGPDLEIPISSVAVTKRSGNKTPEGMDASGTVSPGAFGIEAEITYDDGKVHVVRDVAATYVRGNDDWQLTGQLTERGTSYTARAGVDENKALSNVGAILDAASTNEGTPLSSIYADGSYSIVGNVFKESGGKDTATNDVTVHCSKDGGFYAYDGNIVAHFAFESGTWTLRSAEADSSAATRNFTPLVGTWSGDLILTQSNGASCYGAQGQPLVVSIDDVGDSSTGGGQVRGTITAIAHFHERFEEEKSSSDGDTPIERLDFTGIIRNSRDEENGSNLTLDCTTTGSPDDELAFTISFGTDDDPSAVVARVTSTHTYEELLLMFIPHQTTAEFTDTYLLSRS